MSALRRIGRALLNAVKLQMERDLRAKAQTPDPVKRTETLYARWHGLSYEQWRALPARVRHLKRDQYFRAHRL